ncbi:site-specific DNA-methyltransferase [Sphingopyxis sp. L1A2A]|uniref:site-specific DNA-methyltransferase n=1 Tax=Sphingopyxis sp. L1A2A TaxID=2502247 RepID=UPI0010F6FC61|nr:site-specific DNA-methyltransferase [Sphingopyxis sp. L1A2A]
MTPSIHPFPARMAPELALKSLESLSSGIVLDPMTGSGTVARVAKQRNLDAIGFDLDPLAVLISKVGTTPVDDDVLTSWEARFLDIAKTVDADKVSLPWIDGDPGAERFVTYWFGEPQRRDLRRIAYLLSNSDEVGLPSDVADIWRIALSRIIVTKKQAASLAQDTSHSRPHRVSLESSYDVIAGFAKSLRAVRKRVSAIPNQGSATISRGDARRMSGLADESIDAVLTSPPYLNAIDYMRGHRMSLIWLGHRYGELSATRSASIGSERKPDSPFDQNAFQSIKDAMGSVSSLPSRHQGMIERYVVDLHAMVAEIARVMKTRATATFVMGNSCLKGVYIQNSEAIAQAANIIGLKMKAKIERDLPAGSRYLPTPTSGALSKRMRKEIIMTFAKI